MVISFAGAIAAGTLVLYLASASGPADKASSGIDVLFTVTSAICVTGLTVRDTGGDFTVLGQAIILSLIQVGGLGILTFSNLVLYLQTGRMSLQQRQMVQDTIGMSPSTTAASLLIRVVLYALTIEMAGAIVLTARFAMDFPLAHAAWLGVFHAVSAFCNAGFGLFSDNLAQYRGDVVVTGTIMILIVLGGFGFVVLSDVGGWIFSLNRGPRRRIVYQSRVVLLTSGVLILAGAIAVFALETRGAVSTGPLPLRILDSFFLAVTSRTAGFNTIATGYLTNGTLFVVIMLMAIGGSPGSTAGGFKTTTLATMFALILSRARNRAKVELLSRTIPEETVTRAMLSLTAFMLAAAAATMVLQVTELSGAGHHLNRGKFLEYAFEVVSALGTVGLSAGVTPSLTTPGKLVIVACMFVGRLGPLIIAASFVGSRRGPEITYPEDDLSIG